MGSGKERKDASDNQEEEFCMIDNAEAATVAAAATVGSASTQKQTWYTADELNRVNLYYAQTAENCKQITQLNWANNPDGRSPILYYMFSSGTEVKRNNLLFYPVNATNVQGSVPTELPDLATRLKLLFKSQGNNLEGLVQRIIIPIAINKKKCFGLFPEERHWVTLYINSETRKVILYDSKRLGSYGIEDLGINELLHQQFPPDNYQYSNKSGVQLPVLESGDCGPWSAQYTNELFQYGGVSNSPLNRLREVPAYPNNIEPIGVSIELPGKSSDKKCDIGSSSQFVIF